MRDQARRAPKRSKQKRYVSPAAKFVTEKDISKMLRKTQSEKQLRRREIRGEAAREADRHQGLGKKARSFRSLGSKLQASFKLSATKESPIDMVINVKKPRKPKGNSPKTSQRSPRQSHYSSRSQYRGSRRASRRESWSSISLLDTQDDTVDHGATSSKDKHVSSIRKLSSGGSSFWNLLEGIRQLTRRKSTQKTSAIINLEIL